MAEAEEQVKAVIANEAGTRVMLVELREFVAGRKLGSQAGGGVQFGSREAGGSQLLQPDAVPSLGVWTVQACAPWVTSQFIPHHPSLLRRCGFQESLLFMLLVCEIIAPPPPLPDR